MSDQELLESYQRHRSQEVFSQLVGRYLNLVYSVAARHVPSPDLAKDVSQAVFLELANHADRLRSDSHLGSWLHVVARRKAIDLLRSEMRRTRHEVMAAELDTARQDDAALWPSLRPLLDEALSTLGANERELVIRRYFQGEGYRSIGEAIGVSEDTAQKRVSRALERLRSILQRRGLVTTAALLSANLQARSVVTAPPSLAGSIAYAASQSVLATPRIATGHGPWSVVQQSIALAALASTAVMLCLVHRRSVAEAELQSLQRERTALDTELARERMQAAQTAGHTAAGAHGKPEAVDADEAQARRIGARIRRLKDWMLKFPSDGSRQMDLLTDLDWIRIASNAPDLDFYGDSSEGDLWRQEGAILRTLKNLDQRASEEVMFPALFKAYDAYRKANGDLPITEISMITPYLSAPLDASYLERYSLQETLKGPHHFSYSFNYRRANGEGWSQGRDYVPGIR